MGLNHAPTPKSLFALASRIFTVNFANTGFGFSGYIYKLYLSSYDMQCLV